MSPIEFIVDRRSGHIDVMMGKRVVGVIEPWPVALRATIAAFGRVGAYYWILMPVDGAADIRRPATSAQVARRLILHRLADWYADAGPASAPMAKLLSLQAEMEREAA